MYRPDTSPDIQKKYDEWIMRLSDEERFLRGISLTRFCRAVCESGIRDRQPNATPAEVKVALFKTIYGDSFSVREKEEITNRLLTRG